MILKAQIPLGELRTDNASTLITFGVFLPSAAEALSVNAPAITHHEKGLSVSLPYFMKMLYDGNIIAHCALWSPYKEGDYFPREDLLTNSLVANLLAASGTQYNRFLCWKHAQDIAFRKQFVLERPDWQSLDSIKFSRTENPHLDERTELPPLKDNKHIFDQIIKSYYE